MKTACCKLPCFCFPHGRQRGLSDSVNLSNSFDSFFKTSLTSPKSLGWSWPFFLTFSKAASRSLWLFWCAMILFLICCSCSSSCFVTTCTSPEIQEIHPAIGSLIRALIPFTSFTKTRVSPCTMPSWLDFKDLSLRTMAGTVVQAHPGWISSIFAGKLSRSTEDPVVPFCNMYTATTEQRATNTDPSAIRLVVVASSRVCCNNLYSLLLSMTSRPYTCTRCRSAGCSGNSVAPAMALF